MLKSYIKENLSRVRHLKPSLFIDQIGDQGEGLPTFLEFFLYLQADKASTETKERFEIIGKLSYVYKGEIDEAKIYEVSGLSVAYPGFGALLYQCAIYHIQEMTQGKGHVICDRDSITGNAEKLYSSMNKSESFRTIDIPVTSQMYSKKLEGEVWDVYSEDLGIDCEYDEYLAGLAKGEFVNTYINKAYQLVEPSLMCDIISELRKNHNDYNITATETPVLTDRDLIYAMEDYIREDHQEALNATLSGFAYLVPNKDTTLKNESDLTL